MIGELRFLGPHYFARHYFGGRYTLLPVPIGAEHRVYVIPASRLVTVDPDPGAAADPVRVAYVAPENRLVRAEVL